MIATELEALKEDYDLGGLNQLVERLTGAPTAGAYPGAVYLLVDAEPISDRRQHGRLADGTAPHAINGSNSTSWRANAASG